jgi:hypothetical protein
MKSGQRAWDGFGVRETYLETFEITVEDRYAFQGLSGLCLTWHAGAAFYETVKAEVLSQK